FELLLSYPLASWHVVLGKFIGATLFTFVMILPTFIYVTFLEMYSVPDYGIITGGYTGLILLSMCYISFGLFASSLTKSQVVAAISCFGMLLMLWAVDMLVEQLGYNIGAVLRTISLRFHFYFFSIGVIDSRGIVFILSVIVFMLLLTVKIIEDKRFRS
ncbi:MAG: ABC transporter permease subunit, partial [Candidatus Muiribacteriota bacterium]